MPPFPSWLIDPLGGIAAGNHGVWHTAGLLLALVLLEAILSADNAVALASLVRHVEPAAARQHILNWGLAFALVLRALAIVGAGVLLDHPVVRLLGGLYLVWLAISHFQSELRGPAPADDPLASLPHQGLVLVLMVAGTDLAFSLDSVSAAFGMTRQLPLVVIAGAMGMVILRLMAAWMLSWMDRFPNLQNAGYLTVLAVGLRLVGQVIAPSLVPEEPVLLLLVLVLFVWGLVQRQVPEP